MASVVIDDTSLTAIANAIRAKNGATATYTPSAMATAINNIPLGAKNVYRGTMTVSSDQTTKVVVTTTTDLGITKTQLSSAIGFYFKANQPPAGDKYLVGSTYMRCGTSHYKCVLYMKNSTISSNRSTDNWGSNSVGEVYYNSSQSAVVIRADTDYILGAGTYEWLLIL